MDIRLSDSNLEFRTSPLAVGVPAKESDGVVLQKRQEVQQAGGGRAALRPDVGGQQQAAGLHPAPQNPEPQGEVHQNRGATRGETAGVARGAGRESVDYNR